MLFPYVNNDSDDWSEMEGDDEGASAGGAKEGWREEKEDVNLAHLYACCFSSSSCSRSGPEASSLVSQERLGCMGSAA